MSFEIEIDYRFDRGGFFDDPAARAAMEAAGQVWEALILDEFADVPAGPAFSMADPSDPFSVVEVTIDTVIDDLRIFVGAPRRRGASLPSPGRRGSASAAMSSPPASPAITAISALPPITSPMPARSPSARR